jgi:quinoprotein glucose dehydrogenase
VHNWNEMTIDEARGIAYIPFGTARYDFYGADREGDNLYGNSLVALDARTGKKLWHFQMIHHDLWDWDLPTAPKLLTIRQNGRNVDAVAQPTKHGFVFVFDRVTGKPIWPIEERPVPKSDIPGEHASPTQPFPTKPAPFARQSFTEKDINPFLPKAEQDAIRERLKKSRNEGLFTPPSLQGSIQMPGHNGGANWGSSGVDPIKGELYIVSKDLPTTLKLIPGDPGAPRGRGAAPPPVDVTPDYKGRFNAPIDFMLSSTNLSMIGPPWSRLTAYDLNTGEIKWQVANGTVNGLPQVEGVDGDTGAHWPRGGVLVTGGGLVFVGTGSDRKLRAYDRDNGKVVWSTDLAAASDGVPATYEVDGRQYIVMPVASGTGYQAPKLGAPPAPAGPGAYVVFALPK